MLNLAAIFCSSFIIALSGAMMPGPLLTVTISESARRGATAGPQIIAGHAVLEFFMIVVLLMGLGPLLQSDRSFVIIALAGASVMLWMAAGMFRSLPVITLPSAAGHGAGLHPVFSGFIMSLANPYWVIWWAAIGLGYVTYSMKSGYAGVACFFTGHISADLAWYTLVSASIAKGKRLMNDFTYRIIIGACAAVLALFALWFAFSGLQRLLR